MLQSFLLGNSVRSSTCNEIQAGLLHSCPFCRCKSLDSSISIKIVAKPLNGCNIRLEKDFIEKKIRSSKIDQKTQNVYYRTFESPRKSGLSPNGNKKIVIQYSSPEPTLLNSQVFNPFSKPLPNQKIKSSFVISSPMKTSPRNIYTNENTPPKAKFLQKKSSRKHSVDRMQYATPIQGLTLVDSERVRKTLVNVGNVSLEPFESSSKEQKDQRESLESKSVSIKGRIDYFQKIPETETKNIIQRVSGQTSSASPFNSLINSSPQVAPYDSLSSTPAVNKNLPSSKRNIDMSRRQIGEFSEKNHQELKMCKKGSEPIEINRIQFTPKSIELTPKGDRYSHQKFDKTLGKLKSVPNYNQNELIYSESDRQTLNNHGGSEKNLPETHVNYEDKLNDGHSRSQQNIRLISEQGLFEKKKMNFQTVQMSDNFSTPKSKHKTYKEETKKESKKSQIRFYPLGDKKKSKISDKSKKKQKNEQNIIKKSESKQNIKGQRSLLDSISNTNSKQQISRDYELKTQSQNNHNHEAKERSNSSVSNLHAAELTEELKLNYDYYFYKPIPHNKLYTHTKQNQSEKNGNIHGQVYCMEDDSKQKDLYSESLENNLSSKSHKYLVKDSSVSENEEIDITF